MVTALHAVGGGWFHMAETQKWEFPSSKFANSQAFNEYIYGSRSLEDL